MRKKFHVMSSHCGSTLWSRSDGRCHTNSAAGTVKRSTATTINLAAALLDGHPSPPAPPPPRDSFEQVEAGAAVVGRGGGSGAAVADFVLWGEELVAMRGAHSAMDLRRLLGLQEIGSDGIGGSGIFGAIIDQCLSSCAPRPVLRSLSPRTSSASGAASSDTQETPVAILLPSPMQCWRVVAPARASARDLVALCASEWSLEVSLGVRR